MHVEEMDSLKSKIVCHVKYFNPQYSLSHQIADESEMAHPFIQVLDNSVPATIAGGTRQRTTRCLSTQGLSLDPF